MTASEAREELEAAIRRAATLRDGTGRPRCLLGNAAVDAILALADAYRDAPPDDGGGRPVHLEGDGEAHSACQYRPWQDPGRHAMTGDPALVTCLRCRRSLRYKSLTGGGGSG